MTFVPYVCCGDYGMGFTFRLVKVLAPHSGIIELGIPFSDPIADGPTIQAASQRSLARGTTANDVFSLLGRLRADGIKNDFALMTYYNIIFSFGQEKFLKRMTEAGAQALIIPDLPLGEDPAFESLATKHGIEIIRMVAPNTPPERIKMLAEGSGIANRSFTYLVSAKGVTGARGSVSRESVAFVRSVRKIAGRGARLFVGFGVSSPEQARAYIGAGADGVIVGSGLINIYSKFVAQDNGFDEAGAVAAAAGFAEVMAEAVSKR